MTKVFRYGSKDQELDRTAEMFLEIVARGEPHLALWLIYDGNRFDTESMKFLCNRVQDRFLKGKTK